MKQNILVADDERSIRELVSILLTEAGYNVLCVADGDCLRKVVQEHGSSLSLVITDLRMPAWQGYRDAERLNKETKIPVLVMTGYLGAYPEQSRRLNVISKPFDGNELVKMVKKMARKIKEEPKCENT